MTKNSVKSFALILTSTFISLSMPTTVVASDECDYDQIKSQSRHVKNEDLLARAVEKNCPVLMETILKKEKDEDLFRATQGFMLNVIDHMSLSLQEMKHVDGDDPAAAILNSKVKVLGQFGDFLKTKCPEDNADSRACKARKVFKEYGQKLEAKLTALTNEEEAENKEADFNNSPEGLIQRACACDKFIGINQKIIDRQKEIGKVSGTVNMATLNGAGSQIVDLKEIKKAVAAKYKTLTKKKLTGYKCNFTEDLTNPLLDGTGINSM